MKLYNIEVLLSFLSDKGFKDENINSNDIDEYYFQKGWNNGVLWVMKAIATLMPDMQTEAVALTDIYRIIAGHNDYHGDNILAALTCIAEGKEVNPVKPLEINSVQHGEWKISCDGYYPYCSVCREEPKGGNMTKYCPNCGVKMDMEWQK